jgi:hypothetical protein
MEAFSDIFIYTLLFITLYFEVFLLVTYIEERKTFTKAPPHPPTGKLPCRHYYCTRMERK